MMPIEVVNSLQDLLQGSVNLSSVDDANILVGTRDSIAQFPTIVLEPVENIEDEIVYNRQRLLFSVMISGITQQHDKDLQVSDMLTLENNIKKALDNDRTLGGYAIDTKIRTTRYEVVDYPTRVSNMIVEIQFQQNILTRT